MNQLVRSGFVTFLLLLVAFSKAYGQVIAEADFEGGTVSSKWKIESRAKITTRRANSGKYALEITYPKGINESSGYLGAVGGVIKPDMKMFFIRWYEFYDSNFDWPVGIKQWRFYSGIGSGPMVWQGVKWQNSYIRIDSTPGGISEVTTGSDAGPVQVGAWQCYEAQVTLNDLPEVRNGVLRFWANGEMKAEKEGVVLRADSQLRTYFTGFWIGGNYSDAVSAGGTGGPLVDSIRYIDDVVISTERIGCLPDVADTTPPRQPTGLRVEGQ